MDLSKFFLGNKFNESEQMLFHRSPFWAAYAQIHNITEGEWVIGHAQYAGDHPYVVFSTKQGVPVAYIAQTMHPKSRRKYWQFEFNNNPFSAEPNYREYVTKAVLRSGTMSYIVSNLKKCAPAIKEKMLAARDTLDAAIKGLINSTMHEGYGALYQRPSVEQFDSDTRLQLLKLAMGEIDRASMDINAYRVCEFRHKEYMREVEKRNVTVEEAKLFAVNDKWLIIKNVLGGLIIGRIPKDTILREVTIFCGYFSITTNEPMNMQNVGWYKSLDDLPTELKADLMPSLMMLKVHTGSDDLLPTRDHAIAVWKEAGSMLKHYWADCPMYLIEV